MIENLYDCVILQLPRRFMNFLPGERFLALWIKGKVHTKRLTDSGPHEEEKGKVTDLQTSEWDCFLEKATETRESTSFNSLVNWF